MKTYKILKWGAVFIVVILLLSGCLGRRAFAVTSVSAQEIEGVVASANGEIWMEGTFINQDLYKLSVNAKGIKNTVIGIAFDLMFDGGRLVFLKYEPGSFLEAGGDPVYLVKSDQENSKVVFGESLMREDTFPNGSGKVADFYFQVRQGVDYEDLKDNLTFNFGRGVVSTFKEIRQDLDQITWRGISPEPDAAVVVEEVDLPDLELMDDLPTTQGKQRGTDYLVFLLIGSLAALVVILTYRLAQNRRD